MRKLVLTAKAKKQLQDIFDYIESKWSREARIKVAKKIYKNFYIIESNPELFPISEFNTNLKKCVVSKQTTIFFSYNYAKISVVSVFDTRQNPTKIKKIK